MSNQKLLKRIDACLSSRSHCFEFWRPVKPEKIENLRLLLFMSLPVTICEVDNRDLRLNDRLLVWKIHDGGYYIDFTLIEATLLKESE